MQIISWNINGFRAAVRKGFWNWFQQSPATIFCLQESKINAHQLNEELSKVPEYQFHNLLADSSTPSLFAKSGEPIYYALADAEKPGYSGVLLFSKQRPSSLTKGLSIPSFDSEGRTLIAHFDNFILFNCYFPNGQRDLNRIPFKIDYSNAVLKTAQDLRQKQKNIIICGDFNVAHTEMDIKNAKSNENNSGFTQQERDWFSHFLKQGYIDTFRQLHPTTNNKYTWWSNMPGVRQKNIGWRIDYFTVTQEFNKAVTSADIFDDVLGSDHCPIGLTLQKK